MGLRRFRAASQQQAGLRPFASHSEFVDQVTICAALEQRRLRLSRGKDEEEPLQSCSAFKAATTAAKKSRVCDITGVAVFVCKHGFVMRAVTMTTAENYTYYEVMLEDILRAYSAPGRKLEFVFVDVACRLHPTLRR
jgi:hypothetical protein